MHPIARSAGPALAAALLTLAVSAHGADKPAEGAPQEIGGAKGWTAYTEGGNSAKICYLVGFPTKSEPGNASRGKIYALVSHRPTSKTYNIVDFELGYPAKDGSNAELTVDGHKFSLFTNKEGAWANDANEDKAVTEALAKGKQAVLRGVSQRGTGTTDTYTLEGFSVALAAMDKACNVKR